MADQTNRTLIPIEEIPAPPPGYVGEWYDTILIDEHGKQFAEVGPSIFDCP